VDWAASGGEVYSSLPNPEQTQDQMGSGYQAAGGYAKAAYLRNLRVQTDMNGTMTKNNGYASTDAAVSGGADPYTIDLHMESSAGDSYFFVGGPTTVTQTFTLKAQSDPGWGNNTDHVKSFTLSGPPQPFSAFGNITITLTSHNGFQTDDNWNIQSVLVTLNGSGGSSTLLSKSGEPLARLTGSSPSVTLHA
jgi:hypothetical protein